MAVSSAGDIVFEGLTSQERSLFKVKNIPGGHGLFVYADPRKPALFIANMIKRLKGGGLIETMNQVVAPVCKWDVINQFKFEQDADGNSWAPITKWQKQKRIRAGYQDKKVLQASGKFKNSFKTLNNTGFVYEYGSDDPRNLVEFFSKRRTIDCPEGTATGNKGWKMRHYTSGPKLGYNIYKKLPEKVTVPQRSVGALSDPSCDEVAEKLIHWFFMGLRSTSVTGSKMNVIGIGSRLGEVFSSLEDSE